jgi:hypothetical protein
MEKSAKEFLLKHDFQTSDLPSRQNLILGK